MRKRLAALLKLSRVQRFLVWSDCQNDWTRRGLACSRFLWKGCNWKRLRSTGQVYGELKKVTDLLGIPETEALSELGGHWWQNRGLGPVPPRDTVLNRLFEVRPLHTAFHCDVTSQLRTFWYLCYQGTLCLFHFLCPVINCYLKAIIHEKVRKHLDQRQASLSI